MIIFIIILVSAIIIRTGMYINALRQYRSIRDAFTRYASGHRMKGVRKPTFFNLKINTNDKTK